MVSKRGRVDTVLNHKALSLECRLNIVESVSPRMTRDGGLQ